MEHFKILYKMLLTPVICVALLYLTGSNLFLYPLIFGLTLSFINWNYHKYHLGLSTLLFVLFQYLVFIIGLFGYAIWKDIFYSFKLDTLNINEGLPYIFSAFVVAPILVFFSCKLFFKFKGGKFTWLIVVATIVILILVGVSQINSLKTSLFNRYNLWQIIMVLAIQLIIYQNELKSMFTSKKETV